MAVMQMERIHLLAMKRDRKDILELLQRRGTVEVSNRPVQDEAFVKEDTSASRSLFEKNAETAVRALEVLQGYSDEKKPFLNFLSGRKAVEPKVNDAFVKVRETVLRVAQRVVQLDREMAESKAEILRLDGQIEGLAPWLELPVPQTFAGTRKTAVFVGSIEGEWSLQAILERLAAAAPALDKVHVDIVHASREQTCIYLVCLKADAALAEEALRSLGFARPPAATSRLPVDKKKELEALRASAEGRIEKAREELAGYTDRMDDIRYLQDHMDMRAEKYDVIERLVHTRHIFALEGYVPARNAQELHEELEQRFECSVERQPVPQADETPVKLRNKAFVRPGETVLESYSLPGKEDIDPTPVMTVFYYFMFGLMFSDAGYGLLMAAVCGILLLTKRNMEDNWKKNLGLFFWCGVSTVFWGVMFGSYFGDAITVVSGTFFGEPLLIKPLWLDPLNNPMSLLMFCLGLGIIHMTFGMVLKAVTLVKNKQIPDILYDVVFPLCIIYPLIIILMGSEMFAGMAGFSLALPEIATTICLAGNFSSKSKTNKSFFFSFIPFTQ